jgi:hypothetical protein
VFALWSWTEVWQIRQAWLKEKQREEGWAIDP